MKILFLKKKHLIYLVCTLLIMISCGVIGIFYNNDKSVSSQNREIPIYNVKRNDKKVAISFDAAWGNEDTEKLIEILDQYQVKATFFVVGDWVDKYPESVKALSDAGHEIMNHSNTHPHLPQLTTEQIKEQITSCDNKIEKITGKKPFLTRVPYGDYDNKTILALKELNHFAIQWSIDSLDWKNPPAEKIVNRVVSKISDGDIVLFHNAAINTPAALPSVIKGIQDKGYEIVPISQLIYKNNYTINSQGTQISNEKTATNESATNE